MTRPNKEVRMIQRGQNFQQLPINIVGSSVFGRYPKVSAEYTYNMFVSDNFLVPYAGYQIVVPSTALASASGQYALTGRGIYSSTKLDKLITDFQGLKQ